MFISDLSPEFLHHATLLSWLYKLIFEYFVNVGEQLPCQFHTLSRVTNDVIVKITSVSWAGIGMFRGNYL
jgi:hypothetical protein